LDNLQKVTAVSGCLVFRSPTTLSTDPTGRLPFHTKRPLQIHPAGLHGTLWMWCAVCVDVLQRQRVDADTDADNGRSDARVGADPCRRSRHEGRLQHTRDAGTSQPLSHRPDAALRRHPLAVRGTVHFAHCTSKRCSGDVMATVNFWWSLPNVP